MFFKSIEQLNFSWTYNELIELPIFMSETIYDKAEKDIEKIKQKNQILKNKIRI